MRTNGLVVGLMLTSGCSASFQGPSDAEDADTDPQAAVDSGVMVEDTGASPDALYWYVEGDWTVAEEGTSAALVLRWVAEGSRPCETTAEAVVLAVEPTRDTAWLAEWSVSLTPDPAGCEWFGPLALGLGFGAPEAALAPAADRRSLSWSTSYGLVVDEGAGPVVIGLAGTAEQLAGTSTAAAEGPLAPGVYELHTLYGVPRTVDP